MEVSFLSILLDADVKEEKNLYLSYNMNSFGKSCRIEDRHVFSIKQVRASTSSEESINNFSLFIATMTRRKNLLQKRNVFLFVSCVLAAI